MKIETFFLQEEVLTSIFLPNTHSSGVRIHSEHMVGAQKNSVYQERIRQQANWYEGSKKGETLREICGNSCNAYLNLSIENTQNYAVCV